VLHVWPTVAIERSVRIFRDIRLGNGLWRGESRARKLWHIAAQVAESLYRPYLEQLWRLNMYAARTVPKSPPRFGALAQQLPSIIEHGSLLVDEDAAHVRNAISHRGGPTYNPTTRNSKFYDDSGWAKEFSSNELTAFIRRMLNAEETLNRILVEFMARSMLKNLWPSVVGCVDPRKSGVGIWRSGCPTRDRGSVGSS
jgi:hypothetical protein